MNGRRANAPTTQEDSSDSLNFSLRPPSRPPESCSREWVCQLAALGLAMLAGAGIGLLSAVIFYQLLSLS